MPTPSSGPGDATVTALFISAAFLVVLFLQFGLRRIYKYRFGPEALEATILGIIWWYVPYRAIVSAARATEEDLLRSSLRARGRGNRLVGPTAVLRLRAEPFIVFTPDDVDSFVAEVNRRVQAASWGPETTKAPSA